MYGARGMYTVFNTLFLHSYMYVGSDQSLWVVFFFFLFFFIAINLA